MTSQCGRCEKAFKNGDKKSKYKDIEYHQDCFRCSSCDLPIRQAFYNLGNDLYRCTDCQQKLDKAVDCSRCSKAIYDEAYIEYRNQSLHAACFRCHLCDQKLGEMLYVEHENQPYCFPCHMKEFAQICAVCGRPFPPGTSTRKYEDQYYHIECFRCFRCGQVILSKNYLVNDEQQRLCHLCAKDDR